MIKEQEGGVGEVTRECLYRLGCIESAGHITLTSGSGFLSRSADFLHHMDHLRCLQQ